VFHLIYLIQMALCLISMTLTGLFALSIAGFSIFNVNDTVGTVYEGDVYLFAVIFVLIGLCIDLSKYIFWAESEGSYYLRSISVFLMLFSWFASVAFFISAEQHSSYKAIRQSNEYQVLVSRKLALQEQLKMNENILDKRLSSEYHKQWKLAEGNLSTIKEIQEKMVRLDLSMEDVLAHKNISQDAEIDFFKRTANTFHIAENTIRWGAFALLAFLLEVCTLASISLAVNHRNKMSENYNRKGINKMLTEYPAADLQKVSYLIDDIRTGKIEPVVRKIRSSQYGLGVILINRLLKDLLDLGMIERDKRNSYKLRITEH